MARRSTFRISCIIAAMAVMTFLWNGVAGSRGDNAVSGNAEFKAGSNQAPSSQRPTLAAKARTEPRPAPWIAAMIAQPDRARAIAHENGVDWCQTQIAYGRRHPDKISMSLAEVCPLEGACDMAANRDANIPDSQATPLTVRLKFNIFRNDDGSNPAASQADADAQMTQVNADYAPSRIVFTATSEFINSTQFRDFSDSEEAAMKAAHADQPDIQVNIFVVNITAGYLGVATFPWDPVALDTMGGVIIDDDWFGAGQKTLTHELGHVLGLWHTHHGVSEVFMCSACWELADHSNGDVAGDFASDTDPTPVNYDCAPPGGKDNCAHVSWGPTDPQNYMGYAPDFCYTEFTPQQWGRMHCWIGAELLSLLAVDFSASPVAGEGSLMANFTYDTPIPATAWKWQFGDGDSALVQDPSHTYAPGLFGVSLLVETAFGELSAVKQNFITVWADTLEVPDTSVLADVAGYWEISGSNAVPIAEMTLPITLTNVPSVLFFDSISFTGTRLEYFESRQVVYDNRVAGQLALRLIADAGGGAPPLAPGRGPMARVHFRTNSSASAGDTSYLSAGPLGAYALNSTTLTVNFTPVFNGATLTIASACDCSALGDLDNDGQPTALDLSTLIDHVYGGAPKPTVDPACPDQDRGDMDCSGFDDALDISVMIDWLYAGGAPPCDPCTP